MTDTTKNPVILFMNMVLTVVTEYFEVGGIKNARTKNRVILLPDDKESPARFNVIKGQVKARQAERNY